jgi:hypothetical protein
MAFLLKGIELKNKKNHSISLLEGEGVSEVDAGHVLACTVARVGGSRRQEKERGSRFFSL